MLSVKHAEEVYADESVDVKCLSLLYQDVYFWNCDYRLERNDVYKNGIEMKLSPELKSLGYRNIFMPYANVSIKRNGETLSVSGKFSFDPLIYVMIVLMSVIFTATQIFFFINDGFNLEVPQFMPIIFVLLWTVGAYLLLSAASKSFFSVITAKLKLL